MGCGGSKAVEVKASSNPGPFVDHETDNHQQGVEFNVFNHTENNNELVGSCYNAKPRLRSAIRPVVSEVNNDTEHSHTDVKPSPLDLVDQSFLGFETPFNRDSGFDSNRANSEASDWAKSAREDNLRSGRLSHNSCISTMRPDSITTDSVITARDLNASFMTVSDDFATPANEDVTLLDLTTPLGDNNMSEFEDSQIRILSNTPSRLAGSVEPRPFSVYPKNIDVIKEESEGGYTPRSLFSPDEVVPRVATKWSPEALQKCTPEAIPTSLPETTPNSPSETTPRNPPETTPKSLPETTPKSPPEALPTSPTETRSILKCPSEKYPKYHPDEVLRHNQKAGWCDWGIYKGMVYDANKVIHTFTPLYDERIKLKNEIKMNRQKSSLHDDSDSSDEEYYYDEPDTTVQTLDGSYPKTIINPTSSISRAIKILLNNGIELDVINQNLTECVIGKVVFEFSKKYWESFRKDVDKVLDDLIRADLKDELSQNVRDVLEQLQRWIVKYRNQNPKPSLPQHGDPNIGEFLLPDGIQNHPERLRQWVESWKEFDLEIPDSGSWPMYEIEDIDLGDPQEIFIASLRSHVDLDNPPIVDVDGEAAWEVLQTDLFADDVMTDEQRRTEENRRYRTDLHDPRRMETRRNKLLTYFIRKYEMDGRRVCHFLQWSQAMEDGERRFQLLCKMTS